MGNINYSVKYGEVSPSLLNEQREKFTTINYLPTIPYKNASRYSYLRTVQDTSGKILHESWFQKVVSRTPDDSYYVVTLETENRLDMVANLFYNSPRYWWVVALANYIIDPFDVPKGTRLRIPPLSALYLKGGVLGG